MAVREATQRSDQRVPEFGTLDLDRYAEIDDFLGGAGLGTFRRHGLRSPVGRNAAWVGTTTLGRQVFVKRISGPDADARIARVASFQQFVDVTPGPRIATPRLLAHDQERGVVVFDAVDDERNGARLVVDEAFTGEVAARVGDALARVHGAQVPAAVEIQSAPMVLPAPALFEAIPGSMYEALSFAEIEAWQLLQSDDVLAAALRTLREREAEAPAVPIHGDFRLDQVIDLGDDAVLVDWEEFRLGDAARDVGAFAGEWLYRSILDIVTDRGGQPPVVDDLAHEEILLRGASNIERHAPLVREFWEAYRTRRQDLDDGFVARAVAFAGWHTIERLLAGSARRARVTGIERAAAGVGRSAVVSPERFGAVIGLGVDR